MSTSRRGRRMRGEDGTSLLIAMAFLGLLATTVVSMLSVTFASFKTTEVTRDRNSNQYAADGGVDLAIQKLRAGTVYTNQFSWTSEYCGEVSASPQSMPSQTINGRTVALTCQTLSGSIGGTGGTTSQWAQIATGYPSPNGTPADLSTAISLQGNTHADLVNVGGPVFNAGKFAFSATSPEFAVDGDIYQHDDAPNQYCTADKAAAPTLLNPTITGTWNCVQSSSYAVPDPLPTLVVPASAAPAQSGSSSGACQILFPGRYTTAPSFNRLNAAYLASGVYYFDNVGVINLQGEIFGGEPAAGESAVLNATPCSNDAAANAIRPGAASGKGVTLILGGNSRLTVDDHFMSKIELFTRVPAVPAAEGTAGITIFAPRTGGSNWSASTGTPILSMAGNKTTMTLHGLLYAPAGNIDKAYSLSNPGGVSLFQGGVVGQRITIKFDQQANNETFSNLSKVVPNAPPTPRTVVVTAVASGPGGGVPTTVQAVIRLDTGAGTPATVLSWRKT